MYARLLLVATLLVATHASDAWACRWLARCSSSSCTTTCVTVNVLTAEVECRLQRIEAAIRGIEIPDDSPALRGISSEVAGLHRKVDQLLERPAPVDLTEEVRDIARQLRAMEGLVEVVRQQGEKIDTLTATVAAQGQKLDRILLILDPPPPPAPTYVSWSDLCAAFPDLVNLFQKTEALYLTRYAPKFGIKDYFLPKPLVTTDEFERLKVEVAAGKKLLLVDSEVCLQQHVVMLGTFAVPGVLQGITDQQGGRGTLLLAVGVGETPTLRSAVLEILLGRRSNNKTETTEGLVVEKFAGTYIVYPRQ